MEGIEIEPRETPDALALMQQLQRVIHRLAATVAVHFCNHVSWDSMKWRIILSLAFQQVRISTAMTSREVHDRIVNRLQQEYYPLRQSPAWCRLAIQALVMVRYVWLAAKMLFLELYLLDLAFWKLHRYARQRNIVPHITRIFSPGFHRLAVLAPLPPSRLRYMMANLVAGIWYYWPRYLSIPLIVWMMYTPSSS
ncbi:hypothetical protein TgHK011_009642 [Trichoderma gracile]|nr:hypothetical protein TgHK011_009642 [Trichoderma gracile]